jgi:hypothetical protein
MFDLSTILGSRLPVPSCQERWVHFLLADEAQMASDHVV